MRPSVRSKPLLSPRFAAAISADECEPGSEAWVLYSSAVKYPDSRVAHVIALMEMHRSTPMHVAELAQRVNLSPSYLTRLFRDEMGCAPAAFDRAQRLHRAYDLVRHSFLSIKQVMADVGWSDPSHFSRDFKRQFGITARALRQQASE